MRVSIASPWLVGFVTSLTSACASADLTGGADLGAGDDPGTVAQAVLPAPQAIRFDTPRRDSSGAVVHIGGDIHVGASIDDPTQNGFAVIRFNPQGQVVWRLHLQSFGGPGTYGSVTTLAFDDQFNLYAAGEYATSTGAREGILVKFDSFSGAQLWATRLPGGGAPARLIFESTNSIFGILFVASTDTFAIRPFDGAILWRGTPSTATAPFAASDMVLDRIGNVVVTGTAGSPGNVVTTKYDWTNGNVLWRRSFTRDASSDERARDMALDSAGNVHITGTVFPSDSGAQPGVPMALKFDNAGTLRSATFDPSFGGASVAVDSADNVIYGQDRAVSSPPFRVTKFDAAGARLWSTALPDNAGAGRSVVNGAGEIFLADGFEATQLSPAGAVIGRFTSDAVTTDLHMDLAGNVYTTGVSGIQSTNSSILTLKFPVAPGTPPVPPTPVTVAAPSNLTATGGRRLVTLRWTDNSHNETGFVLERCTGSTCTNFAPIVQFGPNATSYSDGGLARRTQYRYRLKAVHDFFSVASPYSNVATARTSAF
jgi:hypothetical protein